MTDQTLHCREAFEKWVRTCEGHPFAGQFANLMWKAWQAAWNTRAQASAPEGVKVDFEEVLLKAISDWGDSKPSEIRSEFVEHMAGAVNAAIYLNKIHTGSNAKAGEVDKALYVQACEAVEEWKERALKAEKELERAVRGLEGSSTFMGEPAICTHQWIMKTSKGGCIDECTVCGKIRWHKPVVHAHDCNLNMADVAQRMKGCDCGALSTHDKTKA